MSVLPVKLRLIPVGSEQDVRQPRGRPAHLFADDVQVHAGAAFDDEFIVDVADDEAVGERAHGAAEDVAADSLDMFSTNFGP